MSKKIKDRMPDNVKFILEEINSNILRNYITNLQELCDKYEEEHNTTFKEWQKDIQANKKAIEYINSTTFFGLRNGKTFMSKYLNDLLSILQNESEENE